MGFDARWGVLGAGDFGAPHERERLWIVADANEELGTPGTRREQQQGQRQVLASDSGQVPGLEQGVWLEMAVQHGRDDDGLAPRVERIEAIGNAQVPRVAAAAWRILTHNAELSGPRPLAAEGSRSNDGLGAERPGKETT
jgi:DNA (cytosine-5)-methyltransferase 1